MGSGRLPGGQGQPPPGRRSHRWLVAAGLLVTAAAAVVGVGGATGVGVGGATGAQPMAAALAAEGCPAGSTVAVVAHPDDDLLFLSPGLLRDIAAERCVTTVVVTSGDAGRGPGYARQRELGLQAAYAHMAGAPDAWARTTASGAPRTVTVATLDARPRIRLVFLRLPDGLPDGRGTDASGGTSLQQLFEGTIDSLTTVDEPIQTYTRAELVATLGAVLSSAGATSVRTLDHLAAFGDGDHSDHLAVARLTFRAQQEHAPTASVEGYAGYPVTRLPHNVFGAELAAKEEAFLVYARHDDGVCQSREECRDVPQAGYLPREYPASALADATPAAQPGNVAPAAEATASSESAAALQTADKAVDGSADGWPGDQAAEWASDHEGVGSQLVLTWPSPVTLDRVVLFDRPNLDDRVLAATLTFSDGSQVDVPALDDAGAGVPVRFPARSTTELRVTITEVSGSTLSAGLAEVQAYTG